MKEFMISSMKISPAVPPFTLKDEDGMDYMKLISIVGLDGAEMAIQKTKSPNQDGETFLDATLNGRNITITGVIIAGNRSEIQYAKDILFNAFNPKNGLRKIHYTLEDVVEINHIMTYGVAGSPIFPSTPIDSNSEFQLFMVHIYCPNPYLLNPIVRIQELASWDGGAKFPMKLPTTMASSEPAGMVQNNGHAAVSVLLDLVGPAKNPMITNQTTGEYIRIIRDIGAGERLMINTEFGGKAVELQQVNGVVVNALNWVDLKSTFWQLQVGDNWVLYTSDDTTLSASVIIHKQEKYLGI